LSLSSSRTMLDPMKPVAPVTSAFIVFSPFLLIRC
jgi:hypothetical protein